MSNPLQIVLKTSNLSIGYRSKSQETIVSTKINIELFKGELVGLVGANGVGKSTLIRTLTKVQDRLKGTIELNNRSLDSFNAIELAKAMSIVLTEQIVSKNLSVFELITLGRQPYTNWIGKLTEHDLNIVHEAMAKTNTTAFKNKKCYELSDGQLQKILIARALAQDTDLIILDEPTTHLDMYHKAYVLKFLQKLSRETNKSILFSTHEIDLAIQLCDKIIIMTESDVLLDTPENLMDQGIFMNLFPKDLIAFDNETKSFKVNK